MSPSQQTTLEHVEAHGSDLSFQEMLAPGTILEGRYELGALLGEGSAGYAVEARHVVLGSRLVLKVMRPEHTADPEAVARFRREAQIVATLGHPNIVDVRDFGELRGRGGRAWTTYFVMEHLDGRVLERAIEEEGPFELGRALRIALQMADALAAAHDCGVVHRDVKPANVLVLREGRDETVKMLDFGIAKLDSARVTRNGHVLGTPAYMAPEQAQGRDVDGRADVYALSVVLYELLTGTVPLDDPQPFALLRRVIAEPAPSVATKRPDLPPTLVALIDRGLSKSPDARPSSMRSFAASLEAELRATEATPLSEPSSPPAPHALETEPAQHTIRPRVRRRVLSWQTAVVAAMSFVAIGVVSAALLLASDVSANRSERRVGPVVSSLTAPAVQARQPIPRPEPAAARDLHASRVLHPLQAAQHRLDAPRGPDATPAMAAPTPPTTTRARPRRRRSAQAVTPAPVEPVLEAPAEPTIDRSAVDPWY